MTLRGAGIGILVATAAVVLYAVANGQNAPQPGQAQMAAQAQQQFAQQQQRAQMQLQTFLRQAQNKEGWKIGVDWARGDTGAADCPQLYVATYPECLWNGRNRACLMEKAIASAKANDCANAFRLTVITQCHNGAASTELGGAGEAAVCQYEKGL